MNSEPVSSSINRRIRVLAVFVVLPLLFFLGKLFFLKPPALFPDLPGTHAPVAFEAELFYRGLSTPRGAAVWPEGEIKGMIVPHHYVASALLAGMFKQLAQQAPETVILIGPNHYEKGDKAILTSQYSWQTIYGEVAPNLAAINDLLKNNTIGLDDKVLANEHSVGGLMPFIKHFIPETTVVPVILKRNLSLAEITELSRVIQSYAQQPKTVVVSSIDFSHYLPLAVAEEKDKLTLELMKARDYEKIITLNNDYMDSPPSLVVLFQIMELLAINDFQVIAHDNSGRLIKDKYGETTSYFTIAFSRL